MSEKSDSKAETVPGLGFKDKSKALETLNILEGRDPDYQKLAVKGLIGRAKRTLTLTKDKEKLQNIQEAMKIFEDWLSKFEIENRSKESRAYLPLTTIKIFLPLKKRYNIENKQADAFIEAYEKTGGDYKNLRTVKSGDSCETTWDIVRNKNLKELLEKLQQSEDDLWSNELPSKKHLELILWAYSPENSKLKKNHSKYEDLLLNENDHSEDKNGKNKGRDKKRRSEDSSDEESPKKKNK